jgi:tRNA-specific 2-thiouridylase
MTAVSASTSRERIVVAMSGGVDSSVVAGLLAREGHEVIGLTMQLYDHGAATAKGKSCCAGQDIYDARRVADRLGIAHYVVNYEARFEHDVMTPFAASYAAGETPIPCVLCNQTVKFRDLLQAARELGASALATGHYVRRVDGAAGPELRRAADHERDQSYFLFATTKAQLDFLRFPLGGLPKAETRRLAREFGIAVADKPDSQDICFVPTGHYSDLVTKLRPEARRAGDIVHVDGRVVGRHVGVIDYTVGQRRGLGVGGEAEPLYVVRIEPQHDRVIVGPRSAAQRTAFAIRAVNWLGEGATPPAAGFSAQVKLRNMHAPVPATIKPAGNDLACATVVLDAPEAAITPGQACVFYDGDRVLGGGWIERDRVDAFFRPHNQRREATPAA